MFNRPRDAAWPPAFLLDGQSNVHATLAEIRNSLLNNTFLRCSLFVAAGVLVGVAWVWQKP
jgi:hypothetical protein